MKFAIGKLSCVGLLVSACSSSGDDGGFGGSAFGSGGPDSGDATSSDLTRGEGSATDSGGADEGTSGSVTSSGSATTTSAGESGSSDTGVTQGSSSGSAGGETGAPAEICRHVDVVISVDRSGSMSDAIAALNSEGTFNELVTTLISEVGEGLDDFHLAVIDACPKPAFFHNTGTSGSCNFSSNANYMIGTSELASDPTCTQSPCTTLLEEYSCATTLAANGYDGTADTCAGSGDFNDDDEQPAFTAGLALSQPENAGFVRDESILFVIAITDEDEEMIGLGSQTDPRHTPEEVAQQYIDAKGGVIDNIVFLGIGGPAGGCQNGPYGDAQNATQLRAVTDIFASNDPQRGLYWNFCDPQGLVVALQQGLELVNSACNEIVIPQ